MSSAILYLAIVAIWAAVLVPRWLRHPHAETPAELPEEGIDPAAGDIAADADTGEDGQAGREEIAASATVTDPASPAPADSPSQHSRPRAGPAAPAPAGTSPAARRARILRARRRTLFTLMLLAAGAAALAVAHLAAWWVAVPPGVMLAGFLLLLREAARIDASRAAARARAGHALAPREQAPEYRQRPAGPAAQPAAAAPAQPAATAQSAEAGQAVEAEPDAEIIDISARIGDQLYDQYTDAEARAIGD